MKIAGKHPAEQYFDTPGARGGHPRPTRPKLKTTRVLFTHFFDALVGTLYVHGRSRISVATCGPNIASGLLAMKGDPELFAATVTRAIAEGHGLQPP